MTSNRMLYLRVEKNLIGHISFATFKFIHSNSLNGEYSDAAV